ncbi:RNA polymerase [Ignicoccus pacificus DSM 13166]|uniref:DNA-directed RNA polymerase subunit Rpo11 n=1 Tax=Ignicoccus pacificus DSM 13166 TaxID=940294 RepID=A0A977K9J4_9CREN|nr:RNA polymerase [Ignicoccus pacificus DSM 13166]
MSAILKKPEIVVRTDKELRIKIEGESHTLGNLISKLAAKKEHVTMSVYYVEHPLKHVLWLTIRTDGQVDPLKVLLEVLDEAQQYLERFQKELEEGK